MAGGRGWAAAWAGPAAAALFSASLAAFAAMRTDGYSHGRKAVSELGAVGAPMAGAFNILGFILPGLGVMVLAWVLLRRVGGRTGAILLAGSGLALAAAGVFQADLEHRTSTSTLLHGAAAMGSGGLWAIGLFFLAKPLREAGLRRWAALSPWFAGFLAVNLAWQIGWQALWRSTGILLLPGWGQRIGFFGFFLWVAVTGWLIARPAPGRR